jgi:hypothetical protein
MKLTFIIDKKYDKKYVNLSQPHVKKNFDAIYRKSKPYLEQTGKAYQKSWNEIGEDFSKYVEKQTGYAWFYDNYFCVVSVANQGVSNWGNEPIIVRGWKENAYSQRRITAHELILSHYFEIYRRHYADEGLKDEQVWALAEIAAFAITGLTTKAQTFWPWDFSGYYYTHNYPELVALQKKLKQPFLKRKSFDEYIQKGIRLIKNK